MNTQLKNIKFICNDSDVDINIHPGTTVLDFIRNTLRLTGTKEGCREGDCGACTILIGELVNNRLVYSSANSCLLPMGHMNGKHLVTIEGLNLEKTLNPIQQAFVDEGGTQCGFCTPGFIISLTGYLMNANNYIPSDAVNSLDGNICRCTGHIGIKRAVEKFLQNFLHANNNEIENILLLIENNFLPEYFKNIRNRLKEISLSLKEEFQATEKSKYIVSGGTDLFVQKWDDIINSDIVFINKSKEKLITEVDGKFFIKGEATVSDLVNSEIIKNIFPDIKNYFNLFGSLPIRNRATVAGNIVNASPIGDITCFLLALNATVHLSNESLNRTVPLKDFFKGYKSLDKAPDELIESVSFEITSEKFLFNFEKVSRRTYLDIASVNSSIYLEILNGEIKEIHLSAGGVAPIPLYLKKTGNFLLNKKPEVDIIIDGAAILNEEISPISDARGSAEYKRLLLRQLFYAHFLKLFPEIINAEELL